MSDALQYLRTIATKNDPSTMDEPESDDEEDKEEMADDLTKLKVRFIHLMTDAEIDCFIRRLKKKIQMTFSTKLEQLMLCEINIPLVISHQQ